MKRADLPAGPSSRSWIFRVVVLAGALLALAALGFAASAAQQQKTRPRGGDVASLPKEVREALSRAERVYAVPLAGARWSRVFQLRDSGHALFQVQGVNGRGNKIEIEVTRAGRIVEVEEHGIPVAEVPGAVLDALKARMPDHCCQHLWRP